MDKNFLKAIVISFVVLLLWDKLGFFGKPVKRTINFNNVKTEQVSTIKKDNLNKSSTNELNTPAIDKNAVITPAESLIETNFEEKTLLLKSKSSDIEISNKGGRIKSVNFKKYNHSMLIDDDSYPALSCLRLGNISGIENKKFDVKISDDPGTVSLRCNISNEIQLSSFLKLTNSDYFYNFKVVIKNIGNKDISFQNGIEVGLGNVQLQEKTTYPTLMFSRYTVENKTEYTNYEKVTGKQSLDELFYWAGIQNTTYCMIINETDELRKASWKHDEKAKNISASVATNDFSIAPGQEKVFTFNYYIGPKLYFHIKSLNQSFENVIDYGSIIGPITKALVLFLNWLYSLTGNYGIAIILMTLVFKIVTYPLTHKSMVSMKAMQTLQPQLKLLQTQYKNNQAMMQKELMALYKKNGVNPLSGCLPVLIQLPIFIAFYQAIANSIELQGSAFLLIKDLAAPDKILSFGNIYINILPIFMGAVQFISSKQTTTDPNQKMLIYFFPVFMIVIFYSMPSALNLYFLVSTIIGIIQTWMIKTPQKTIKI